MLDATIKLQNFAPLQRKLATMGAAAGKNAYANITIGYAAPYALFVHENLEARHPNGGQAKFLEQPMREMHDELMRAIVNSMRQRKGTEATEALYLATQMVGNRLLAASKALVPVDTGRLRASAFMTVRKGKARGMR